MREPKQTTFILLCGCPRSGTTLLSSLFETALGVAIPLETHFIPLFRRHLWLYGSPERPGGARRLLAAIEAFTRIWVYRGVRSSEPARHAAVSLLPELEAGAAVPGRYADLLAGLFARFAARHSLSRYGDKSAPFEPEDLELYDRSVDEMRVVHIMRDGRDVWLSWGKEWFGPRSVAEAGWIWRRHVERRRAWGARNPDRYLELRYEDLLDNPDAALATIADFLDLEFSGARSVGHTAIGAALAQESVHKKLSGPLDAANKEKWRERLSDNDKALFAFVAGRTLESCGYEVSGPDLTRHTRLALRCRYAAGMIQRYLSRPYYMRRLRSLLPVVFGLLQLIGLDPRQFARRVVRRHSPPVAQMR